MSTKNHIFFTTYIIRCRYEIFIKKIKKNKKLKNFKNFLCPKFDRMQKKLQDYSVLYKIKSKENYENNEKKQENKKKNKIGCYVFCK